MNKISNNMKNNLLTGLVSLDKKSVYDNLIKKLEHYEIRGIVNKLFKSYFI